MEGHTDVSYEHNEGTLSTDSTVCLICFSLLWYSQHFVSLRERSLCSLTVHADHLPTTSLWYINVALPTK